MQKKEDKINYPVRMFAIIFAVVAGIILYAFIAGMIRESNYQRISDGMSKDDVIRLAGKPSKAVSDSVWGWGIELKGNWIEEYSSNLVRNEIYSLVIGFDSLGKVAMIKRHENILWVRNELLKEEKVK